MTPLTVIGGFLGAGKTTLVNHLLTSADRRWGVLVNDFGAINVDAALIGERAGEMVALTNGCVCCTMGDDLGAALARLAARAPGIDHVIVETSGVSDPWRTAQLALIEPGYSLEPIVVVADAAALTAHLTDRWVADTIRTQLMAAELVILNKADLADPAIAAATLRTIRPNIPVIETRNARVPPDRLRFPPLGRSAFRADTPSTHLFQTWHWIPPAPLNRAALRDLLGRLPASVLRVKGTCHLAGEPHPFVLQFAARQWALAPLGEAPRAELGEAPRAELGEAPRAPGWLTPGLIAIGTPEMPAPARLAALFSATVAG